jgi:hypothetical protein
MRFVVALAVICLAACAAEKLEQTPPAGVDFSGHWKLNEADSDNPQHLAQTQLDGSAGSPNATGGGSPGGSGGRGGRQGGGRGGSGPNLGTPGGPVMPSMSAVSDGLRWPGKLLDVKQVAGAVTFTSEGNDRVCRPLGAANRHEHHQAAGDRGDTSTGRDASPRGRDAPPPRCGWSEKTLIVQGGDPDDEHPPFEEHYSLSEDGQRLVEVVSFKGGRSSGFTLSRVWDRSGQ